MSKNRSGISGGLNAALEADSLDAIGDPFLLSRPLNWTAPVIFTSPHSGSFYPDSFLARSACDVAALRVNEDAYIDQLFAPAVANGAPLLAARFPRCFVDVNRAPSELPPEWEMQDDKISSAPKPTARAQAGFGVIPLMMGPKTPIYKDALHASIASGRLDRLYRPYHAALQTLIDEATARFGRALVIDCHSMPGFAAMGSRRADIVLGDRYGLSCRAKTTDRVEAAFRLCGYEVVRNTPYAGGYVTTHYGRSAREPERVVETIQIEVNRDLYLNPVTYAPKSRGYRELSQNLEDIIAQIMTSFHSGSAVSRFAAE